MEINTQRKEGIAYNRVMIFSQKSFQSIDGRRTDLVITCATDAVRATLFYFESGHDPQVLTHTSRFLSVRGVVDESSMYQATITAIELICDDISAQSGKLFQLTDMFKDHQQIHHVSIFLASPWTRKEAYQGALDFEHPTVVTHEHINSLLRDKIPQGQTRLDSYIASIHANEYKTTVDAIIGKKAKNISISVVDTFTRFDRVETIFQVLHSKLNITESQVTFLPMVTPLLTAVERMYKPTGDYMVVYMHERQTDIVLFSHSMISQYFSLSFGFRTIIDEIMSARMADSVAQVYSLVATYARGHLHDDSSATLRQVMGNAMKRFEQDLQDAFSDPHRVLPRDWYIVHDNYFLNGMIQGIRHHYKNHRIVDVNLDDAIGDDLNKNIKTIATTSAAAGIFLQDHDQVEYVR